VSAIVPQANITVLLEFVLLVALIVLNVMVVSTTNVLVVTVVNSY